MKRIYFLILLILLFFCGCSVCEIEEKGEKCFLNRNITLNVVLSDVAAQGIETKAAEFERLNPNVVFKFKRIEDDAKYRTNLLKEIVSDGVDVFFVHGEKEANFFKNVAKEFDLKKDGNNKFLISLKEVLALKALTNFSGLWVNLNILKQLGFCEKDLSCLKDVLNVIKKAKEQLKNIKPVLSCNLNIAEIFCEFVSEKGDVLDDFETILPFIDVSEKDAGKAFLTNKSLFYLGSSKFLNDDILKDDVNFKCLPFFIGKNKIKTKEDEFFCFNKNITQSQKEQMLKFSSFLLLKNISDNVNEKAYLTSKIGNMPVGFKDFFCCNLKKLKERKVSFKQFKENFKKDFIKYSDLDVLF